MITRITNGILFPAILAAASQPTFNWALNPLDTANASNHLEHTLADYIKNPELALDNPVTLPDPPKAAKGVYQLGLREAILLALRYNPNIKNRELDRIIERYALRRTFAEYEMQFALSATALIQNTHFTDIGNTTNTALAATPEMSLKNTWGGRFTLNMNNKLAEYGNYDPIITATFTQPLLRGFGAINKIGLLNATDEEHLHQLMLRQTIMDQITEVSRAWYDLVLSKNNLKNLRQQQREALQSWQTNDKKISTGFLEQTANVQQAYQNESLAMMVEQAENDLRVATQNLLQIAGLDPAMKIDVPDDVHLDQIKIPELQISIDKALVQNTDLAGLQNAFSASQRALLAAENEQLWQLDFNANIQTGITNDATNVHGLKALYSGNNLIEAAGITLSIPVRDVNRKSRLLEAKIQLEKARLNLQAFRQNLITAVKNTITTITSLKRRYKLAEKQVKLAEASYQLEKKKQDAGISSALEVTNTQNQLLDAQAGLISAKIALLNQIANLNRLIGQTIAEWHIDLEYC